VSNSIFTGGSQSELSHKRKLESSTENQPRKQSKEEADTTSSGLVDRLMSSAEATVATTSEAVADHDPSVHGENTSIDAPDQQTNPGAHLAKKALVDLERRITVIETTTTGIFKQALEEIRNAAMVAVDCEGVAMSRTGRVTLIQVATEHKVYLFDVLKLGSAAFEAYGDGPSGNGGSQTTLKHVLEGSSVLKLMYDCRRDSDSLFHQFNVKLQAVLDIQLLDVALHRQQGQIVERLSGFARCARLWLGSKTYGPVMSLKEKIKSKYAERIDGDENSDIWAKRPMCADVLRYAAVDVALLFPMHTIMMHKHVQGDVISRTKTASEERLAEYRDMKDSPLQGVFDPTATIAPQF